ncbi:Histidine kinase [Azospirillaceae bacterium]
MRIAQCVIGTADRIKTECKSLIEIDPHLALVFGSVSFFTKPGFFEDLREAFPFAALVGCSTAGEICADGLHEGKCVITAIRFQHTVVRVVEAPVDGMLAARNCGERLGVALAAPNLAGTLVFSRGVDINGTALIEGLAAQIGSKIPISGGLAGDDGAFKRTFVLLPSGISDAATVAVGFYGDRIKIGHGSFGGWEPFGPIRKITRSDGNILYELDGESALEIYKRYLGDYAKNLPASGLLFPFELLNENHSTLGLIRTILGVDEVGGGLILAGAVKDNGYLRLMHANTESLINGAQIAAQNAIDSIAEAVADADIDTGLALLVSCVGRKLVMGDRVDEEVSIVVDTIGSTFTYAGFYSYGEINPMNGYAECKLHNQSMTIALIQES